jgi:hypothetical protein
MEDGPTHEWDSSNPDPNSMRKRGQASSPMNRTPLPLELMDGVKGALEGKLDRRESPDILMSRNILRAHPTTAGRVSAGAQVLLIAPPFSFFMHSTHSHWHSFLLFFILFLLFFIFIFYYFKSI